MTGVDRTAQELMRAYLAAYPDTDVPCLLPGAVVGSDHPDALIERCVPRTSYLPGALWEQLSLARAAPDRYLLGLCNTGPVLRKRQVVMIHDAQVFDVPQSYSRGFRTWYRAILPKIGHRAAMILTVSEASKAALIRHRIAPAARLKIVPNGVDHIHRMPADDTVVPRNNLVPGDYLLTIGASAHHKNMQVLRQALSLRQSVMPLVVIGDARAFAGCGDHIVSVGRVDDAQLRGLYENARGFLLPSLTEGFGLPAGEAMLCGCPVIASTGGALPEVCGSAAIYVDPHDPVGWATAMDGVASLTETQWQAARQSCRAQGARWTWASAAQTLHAHLSNLPPLS